MDCIAAVEEDRVGSYGAMVPSDLPRIQLVPMQMSMPKARWRRCHVMDLFTRYAMAELSMVRDHPKLATYPDEVHDGLSFGVVDGGLRTRRPYRPYTAATSQI